MLTLYRPFLKKNMLPEPFDKIQIKKEGKILGEIIQMRNNKNKACAHRIQLAKHTWRNTRKNISKHSNQPKSKNTTLECHNTINSNICPAHTRTYLRKHKKTRTICFQMYQANHRTKSTKKGRTHKTRRSLSKT